MNSIYLFLRYELFRVYRNKLTTTFTGKLRVLANSYVEEMGFAKDEAVAEI